jgi:hypothetical protein
LLNPNVQTLNVHGQKKRKKKGTGFERKRNSFAFARQGRRDVVDTYIIASSDFVEDERCTPPPACEPTHPLVVVVAR